MMRIFKYILGDSCVLSWGIINPKNIRFNLYCLLWVPQEERKDVEIITLEITKEACDWLNVH